MTEVLKTPEYLPYGEVAPSFANFESQIISFSDLEAGSASTDLEFCSLAEKMRFFYVQLAHVCRSIEVELLKEGFHDFSNQLNKYLSQSNLFSLYQQEIVQSFANRALEVLSNRQDEIESLQSKVTIEGRCGSIINYDGDFVLHDYSRPFGVMVEASPSDIVRLYLGMRVPDNYSKGLSGFNSGLDSYFVRGETSTMRHEHAHCLSALRMPEFLGSYASNLKYHRMEDGRMLPAFGSKLSKRAAPVVPAKDYKNSFSLDDLPKYEQTVVRGKDEIVAWLSEGKGIEEGRTALLDEFSSYNYYRMDGDMGYGREEKEQWRQHVKRVEELLRLAEVVLTIYRLEGIALDLLAVTPHRHWGFLVSKEMRRA